MKSRRENLSVRFWTNNIPSFNQPIYYGRDELRLIDIVLHSIEEDTSLDVGANNVACDVEVDSDELSL